MSTRATYQFTGARTSGLNHSFPSVTIYIHHDGYPEGAAFYFWNAHHSESYDTSPLARFFRANERAEFTESHEAHGDTEYRYTIEGANVTAYKGYWPASEGQPKTWRVIFSGTIVEFINQFGPASFIEDFEPLRRVPNGHAYNGTGFEWLTRKQILTRAETALKEHDEYKAKFPHFTGNIDGHARACQRWSEALKAYDAEGPVPVRVKTA